MHPLILWLIVVGLFVLLGVVVAFALARGIATPRNPSISNAADRAPFVLEPSIDDGEGFDK